MSWQSSNSLSLPPSNLIPLIYHHGPLGLAGAGSITELYEPQFIYMYMHMCSSPWVEFLRGELPATTYA